jgi:hypothetical protein
MTNDKPRNMSASIRQRLLNHSTAIKADPNLVLIWYGLERFLYRLSVSTHCERFVLKGAMLFRLWGGANFRSTKDLDLEGFLQDEAEVVREVFASICVQPVEDDGLVFDASTVNVAKIRDTQEYGGFRVLLTAKLGTAILRLQIDVGFGDAITPEPAITEYPSILGQLPAPSEVLIRISPAGVSETLRVVLLKRRTPRRASSDAIAWLSAEAEMPRSFAAARKLFRAAIAAAAFSSENPGVSIVETARALSARGRRRHSRGQTPGRGRSRSGGTASINRQPRSRRWVPRPLRPSLCESFCRRLERSTPYPGQQRWHHGGAGVREDSPGIRALVWHELSAPLRIDHRLAPSVGRSRGCPSRILELHRSSVLAVGITQRWSSDGIRSNALHPGAIATGLQKHTGGLKTPVEKRKTLAQGASTSVLLAASPLLEGVSGLYFEDCNQARQVSRRPTDFTGGYAAYAVDPGNAERLWDLSLKLIA